MKSGGQTPAEVKKAAKELLNDPKKFDEVFENVFKKSDKNFDKKIDEAEYYNFINLMLKDFGRTPLNFDAVMRQFKFADKNKDGKISKDEFKNQLLKLLNLYVV